MNEFLDILRSSSSAKSAAHFRLGANQEPHGRKTLGEKCGAVLGRVQCDSHATMWVGRANAGGVSKSGASPRSLLAGGKLGLAWKRLTRRAERGSSRAKIGSNPKRIKG